MTGANLSTYSHMPVQAITPIMSNPYMPAQAMTPIMSNPHMPQQTTASNISTTMSTNTNVNYSVNPHMSQQVINNAYQM